MPITPYSGSWGKPQIQHLLRRTLFGFTKADYAYFQGKTLNATVTELLTVPASAPPPPLVDYVGDATLTQGVDTWVNGPVDGNNTGNRQASLRGWWAGLMINQERNIREKMVMLWHDHIPTDIGNTVSEPIYCYRYNALLRQYALGNFKTLVRQMTIEPAMLYYLSGRSNTKSQANENFARELQELFTVGKDLPSYYTEGDVQTAAKVLTGWSTNNTTLTTTFTPLNHTTGNKTFSSFYNNTIITGKTIADATSGPDELDALMNMIFSNAEVARYVVRKIYRFFVYYKIDATVEANVIVPLADLFRTGGYEIKPVMQALLTSQHFYDITNTTGSVIKNPVDHTIVFARVFGVTFPSISVPTDYKNLYQNWRFFNDSGNVQQMRPGNPPNVAGWSAYYQAPTYHELWINAETLRQKKIFTDRLLTSNYNTTTKVDVLAFTATLNSPSDPNALIAEVIDLMLVQDLDTTLKAQLKAILLSNQVDDTYWTVAWNNYVSNPSNTTYQATARTRLQSLYQAIVGMAEYLLH